MSICCWASRLSLKVFLLPLHWQGVDGISETVTHEISKHIVTGRNNWNIRTLVPVLGGDSRKDVIGYSFTAM